MRRSSSRPPAPDRRPVRRAPSPTMSPPRSRRRAAGLWRSCPPAPAATRPAPGTETTDPDEAPAGEPAASARPVAQLPADLMRRTPIQPERYRRWQTQWADLQAPDVSLDEVAERHGVGRRHLTWVRAAGQAGWLDHPDPPAWRLAALGAHSAGEADNQPHNG